MGIIAMLSSYLMLKSVCADIFSKAHGHRHSCPVQPYTRVYAWAYTQFAQRLFRQKTLQDELKVQSSPLPWKKAVEQLCMMSYKMTVHVIFPTPLVSMNRGNYVFPNLKKYSNIST